MASKFWGSYDGTPNPAARKRVSVKTQGKWQQKEEQETVQSVLDNTVVCAVPQQNISKECAEYFGIRSALSEKDGVTVVATYFPYYDHYGKLTGFKKRDWTLEKLTKGHFSCVGSVKAASQFFGQLQIAQGSNRTQINVCEGEGDVCAAWQTYVMKLRKDLQRKDCPAKYKQWAKEVLDGIELIKAGQPVANKPVLPFIGLNCGTANAVDTFANNEKFIREFQKIVLALDNDECSAVEKEKKIVKGKEATEKVAEFLLSENIFVVDYPCERNDPNGPKDIRDMFKSGDLATIYKMFQKEHHHFAPDKIISVGDISIQQLRKRKGEGIPLKMFPELQKMTHGPRKGELWTLTGPSGSGKSTISRKIEYAIAEYLMDEGETIPRLDGWTPEEKMCIIRLEEEEEETLNSLYAEGLGIDPKGFAANPEEFLTEEEHNTIHQYYIKKDKIKIFDHFGSIPTKQLIAKLKQMVFLYGCRWIILDHLSMVVSGLESDNERKDLDIIMTELAAFCVQYDVFVLSICHIRRVQVEPPKNKKGVQLPFFQPVRKENLRGCVSADTEFLTPQGWKRIDEYAEGDLVAQHDENGVMTFVAPKAYINLPCEEMWHVSNTHVVDMMLSDEHRVVYVNDRTPEVFRMKTMLEVVYDHNNKPAGMRGKIPTTFITGCDGSLGLTDDQLRLQIAVNADGTVLTESTGRVAVRIKKERKKQRLEMLLERTNTPYRSFDLHGVHEGRTEYQFKAPCGYKGVTEEWFNLKQHELEIICDEVMYWDGDSVSKNRVATISKFEADFFQFAYSACGHRTSVSVKENNNTFKDEYDHKPLYIVRACDTKYMHIRKGGNNKPSIERVPSPDGRKYCFTLPSGMWVARRNGHIFITGNSAAIEQLSWVVLAVEPEELPDRSRGRIRLVSLKNRPWKILGIADTMMMDKNGQFHDASRWEWKEEEGCFECDGEVVYKMPGATINLDPDDLEEPVTDTTPQPTIVNEDDDMDGSPF
jgi:hypothetical protein